MVLLILRALFILVASGLAVVILFLGIIPSDSTYLTWGVFIGVIGIAVGVIAIDMAIRRKHLEVISAIYFGLIVGLFLAYVASLALTPFVSATLFGENTARSRQRSNSCSPPFSATRASACSCRRGATSGSSFRTWNSARR